jgi:hypothetical protein
MPKTNFDKCFSDAEKAQFQVFADNPHMTAAIKKALLLGLYTHGTIQRDQDPDPTQNFALALAFNAIMERRTNEDLGADLRACAEGIRILETAFNNILDYKTQDEKKVAKGNPAR